MRLRQLYKDSTAFMVMALVILLGAHRVIAQTSSFTYQGRLTDGGSAATGNYDFQFALWDSSNGGAQIGTTLTLNAVAVSNGVFTVALDFGAASFNGANRFLEISARPIGGGAFTLLSPRQPVTAIPYAIRSLNAAAADTATNATQLGGVGAIQYVQTSDSRLSDPRAPTAGSSNYIQSNPNVAQGANFNITGDGTAGGTLSGNIVNAARQFNIGNNRVFAINGSVNEPNTNTFAGVFAGNVSVPDALGDGTGNSFFGYNAGGANTTGFSNSFFGINAGANTQVTGGNSFFGFNSGFFLTAGFGNAFFGADAGQVTKTSTRNTAIGFAADVGDGFQNATAIGAFASVAQDNSLVLGGIKNVNQATNDTKVGIGTTTPRSALEVKRDWDGSFGALTVTGDRPTIRFSGGAPANNDQWILHLGSAAGNAPAGSVSFFFGGAAGTSYGSPIFSVTPAGTVQIHNLAAGGGSTQLCRNATNEITNCSSSLRYKSNIARFSGGLNVINRLRPISFEWKQDGKEDVGFGAEEVEKVAPLFTFRNDKGDVEGVRYDRLSVLFVNAFKEQQAQIEQQQRLIEQQQAELKALKDLICRSHSRAVVCK